MFVLSILGFVFCHYVRTFELHAMAREAVNIPVLTFIQSFSKICQPVLTLAKM